MRGKLFGKFFLRTNNTCLNRQFSGQSR